MLRACAASSFRLPRVACLGVPRSLVWRGHATAPGYWLPGCVPPAGPVIRPDQLAGAYEDPDGGIVHLTVEGDTFRMHHSQYGPVPSLGTISSSRRYISCAGFHASFDGFKLYWSNGVAAWKLETLDGFKARLESEVAEMPDVTCQDTACLVDQCLRNVHIVLGLESEGLAKFVQRAERSFKRKGDLVSSLVSEFVDSVILGRISDEFTTDTSVPSIIQVEVANRLVHWKSVTRGNQIFIRGLGTFDIKQAQKAQIGDADAEEPFNRLVEVPEGQSMLRRGVAKAIARSAEFVAKHYFRHSSLHPCDEEELRSVLPSPGELRLRGYGPSYFPHILKHRRTLKEIFELTPDDFRLQHLVRWRHWWNNQDCGVRLDELMMAPAVESELPQGLSLRTRPRRLLDELLALRHHDVERGVAYEWLASCPNFECGDSGTLRPLRTSDEVLDAAAALHNCAADYADDVKDKECILVVLVSKGGSYRAMGMAGGAGWEQVVADRNRPPSPDVLRLFAQALPHFEQWLRQHR